jgi:hypothetical protein
MCDFVLFGTHQWELENVRECERSYAQCPDAEGWAQDTVYFGGKSEKIVHRPIQNVYQCQVVLWLTPKLLLQIILF